MSDGSSIQWCDATWTPLVGCTRVSAGCDQCYAVNMVHRFRKADGLTKLRPKTASRPGLDWTGKVLLQPERLVDPLKWKKPRRIFVCSQADLFHDQVPFEYIAAVFGIMAASPQHTFLVLTKRPERARGFFALQDASVVGSMYHARNRIGPHISPRGLAEFSQARTRAEQTLPWPLTNVHLGVSIEDQETADERIPLLLDLPAAVRWVSAEPLLEAVTFRGWKLAWVVIGGESGPRARGFVTDWARSLIAWCRAIGALPFVKQLGTRPFETKEGTLEPLRLADYSGGVMSEWAADLRVQEIPT